jgi:hypothetical protein
MPTTHRSLQDAFNGVRKPSQGAGEDTLYSGYTAEVMPFKYMMKYASYTFDNIKYNRCNVEKSL